MPRLALLKDPSLPRDTKGRLAPYTSLGSYPLLYLTRGGNVLCAACARKTETAGSDAPWHGSESGDITGADINYEDPSLYCDDCGTRIESAYAEDN